MRIQKILSYTYSGVSFQANAKKDYCIDKFCPTLRDLYESEDRLIENQEKLYRQQNKLLANVIKRAAVYSAYPNAPGVKDKFVQSLNLLEDSNSEIDKDFF